MLPKECKDTRQVCSASALEDKFQIKMFAPKDYQWRRPMGPTDASVSMLENGKWNIKEDQSGKNNHCVIDSVHRLHVPRSVNQPSIDDLFSSSLSQVVPYATALRSLRNVFHPSTAELPDDTFQKGKFFWMDQMNNSSGESSSRKAAAKEMSRKEIENWIFMHFRIRSENYMNIVAAERAAIKGGGYFADEILDKWTHKFRFRIRKDAPMKTALVAFASRMGLLDDADITYCCDGFYGDAMCGRIGNPNAIPNRIVPLSSTPFAAGLRNGSSVFVSRVTETARMNAVAQMKLELADHDPSDDDDDLESVNRTSPPTAVTTD